MQFVDMLESEQILPNKLAVCFNITFCWVVHLFGMAVQNSCIEYTVKEH